MPMASVLLRPGVNIEATPSLNEAGISQSQLIRTKNGLTQTYGGWESFVTAAIPSTVKDLHAWQDVAGTDHLGIGAASNLMVITSGSASDITPQITTTNPTPNFSISSGSATVTVTDPNSAPTVYNTVFFNTPIAIGNLLLNGAYQIQTVGSTGSYTITSSVAASTTISSSGKLPIFTTTSGSPTVTVTLSNNNFTATLGLQQTFRAPTSVGGLTISGPYNISTVIDSTNFTITATMQASTSTSATMNSSLAQLVYYVTQGPQSPGSGFGSGGFGDGGFGTGTTTTGEPGTPITAIDWSQDNWGEILLACPKNGAIYTWSPDSGYTNAQVIAQAPFFNGGIFISMPQQILVAWKSTQSSGTQDNLKVRWCNAADFTNWAVTSQTTAGSFQIPTGSVIVGGLQAQNFGVVWTDVDVWQMSYVGGDVIFNFTRVGSGCGLIGQHAAGVISGEIYWCGKSNFFKMGANGVQPIPCTVWDYIFQNLNTAEVEKIRCCPNSAFNEIMWEFPSGTATENNAYVKLNTVEGTWDYGLMTRTAWTDISVLGNPIGADTGGFLWQHEMGDATPGASNPSFQSGWWSIGDGNDLAFVDYVIPDFNWGTYGTNDAEVNMTFYSADYPGDSPKSYGPYTVTQATEYITPRIRGRLMSVLVQSNNSAFSRLGRIRFRWGPAGRR